MCGLPATLTLRREDGPVAPLALCSRCLSVCVTETEYRMLTTAQRADLNSFIDTQRKLEGSNEDRIGAP
jgi:hypothetical protein